MTKTNLKIILLIFALSFLPLHAKKVLATDVSLNFEDLAPGTVLTDEYASLGIQFNGASVFNPSMISNPPAGNSTNFILPSAGYNANGTFSINFIDPITLFPISTPFITFTAYLGTFGEVSDSFDVFWDTPVTSGKRQSYRFFSAQTFNISDAEGITNIRFQDWGVNAFDNFQMNLTVSVVPEPLSSFLFISGGASLGLRRYIKRKYRT
jgi:hypothetical protein